VDGELLIYLLIYANLQFGDQALEMEVMSISVGWILACRFPWIPLNVVFNPFIVLASMKSHSSEFYNLIIYFVEKVCFVLKTS